LFAVADGIGGHERGELASALAVAALVAEMRRPGPVAARLRAGFAEANRRIVSMQRALGQVERAMGTTLTALAVRQDGRAAVCHLGDSRLYRLRGDRLELLTEDHSVAAELVRTGGLEPAEALRHPQRHVLTRSLGLVPEATPDQFSLGLEPGDLYLLATDGLTAALSDADIARVALSGGRFEDLAPALVAAANAGGGPDNVTVVAVAVAVAAGGGAAS
jgi:serine/threonine protein phosphatase PrpC